MNIRFVLVSEGTSDDGLIPHLESLCIEAGADEVTGIAPDLSRVPRARGHTLEDRIPVILKLEPQANLLLIHRDADSDCSEQRYAEIRKAVTSCRLEKEYVAVVPVQETEAWLLLDEGAIRAVAEKPNGRNVLNLPRPTNVESVAHPKERLREALTAVAQLSGRRHKRFAADFSSHRRLLLHRLPVGGPLLQVPSWVAMKAAIEEAIGRLASTEKLRI
jgi:hypothetical protein